MEGKTTAIEADYRSCFGTNFIGSNELFKVAGSVGLTTPSAIPEIPFTLSSIRHLTDSHILILGCEKMKNGDFVTLETLRKRFGFNPDVSEPCFYNQDWYVKESFFTRVLKAKWYLVRKNILDKSRAVSPEVINEKNFFPSAVLLAYTFFVNWYCNNECLWPNDFIWCEDVDANSDRIYVGRYYDQKGLSKNGFSIHRHLSIRKNYGCLDYME